MWEMHLYRISADGGNSWSTQWLTDEEAKEQIDKYHYICEKVNNNSFKDIY